MKLPEIQWTIKKSIEEKRPGYFVKTSIHDLASRIDVAVFKGEDLVLRRYENLDTATYMAKPHLLGALVDDIVADLGDLESRPRA